MKNFGVITYKQKRICFFFSFSEYLLIIILNNYIYNTTEKKNTLTIDINRVKQN